MLHQPSMANILLWSVYVLIVSCCCCLVAKSCLTLCDLMDCSPPGPSALGILQTRILVWVATPSSRASSWPRDWTHIFWVSCIAHRFFTPWVIGEAPQPSKGAVKGKRTLLCRGERVCTSGHQGGYHRGSSCRATSWLFTMWYSPKTEHPTFAQVLFSYTVFLNKI